MKRIIIFFAILVAGLTVACGGDDPAASGLEGPTWELVHYGFGEVVVPDAMVTVTFEDGQIRGSTGCNEYSGSYDAGEGTITFGDIAVTERACLDETVMAQERDFLDALQGVGNYAVESGTLTMNYADGILVFQNPNFVAEVVAMAP